MTKPVGDATTTPANERPPRHERSRRPRAPGFRSADVLRTAALVIGMYFLAQLIRFAHPLFLTAFLGILFGLAVSAGVDALSPWRLPRGVSAALIVVTFFGLLVGFGAWMAPTLHRQGIELRRQLPDAIDRVEAWINARRGGVLGLVFSDAKSAVRVDSASTQPSTTPPTTPVIQQRSAADSTGTPSTLRGRMGAQLNGATRYLFPFLSSTMQVVAGLLIIVFLSIYIAVDPDMYHRGLMMLFPRPQRKRAGEVLSAIAAVLKKWLVTQLIAMLTIGVVTTVLLLVLRVKAAFALGLLAGLLEFIPTVGPIVSALPAVAMGFLDSPEKALSVAVAYVGIQFFENHLLIPLLMKGGIDLPPALTVFSQALMALTFGFLGLMCAVPLLAATVIAVKMLYVEDVVGEQHVKRPKGSLRGAQV
jgi:predicted PurR-regulated permease PerM